MRFRFFLNIGPMIAAMCRFQGWSSGRRQQEPSPKVDVVLVFSPINCGFWDPPWSKAYRTEDLGVRFNSGQVGGFWNAFWTALISKLIPDIGSAARSMSEVTLGRILCCWPAAVWLRYVAQKSIVAGPVEISVSFSSIWPC